MEKKYSAVIVEDEAIISMMISVFIKNLDIEVLGTANGAKELKKLLQNNNPDIIFMDIYLDGPVNGIEIVKEINRDHNYIVVYMTANSDPKTKQSALGTNHFAYIQKPVSEHTISGLISIIRNSRL